MSTAVTAPSALATGLEFRMPSLGADMEYGTVVGWRVKPGDRIDRGAVVAEVETEKGVFEVDVPFAGTVEALVVPSGTKVKVGTVLARFAAPGTVAATAPPPPPERPAEAPARRASPAARRLAAERAIDLGAIEGSGPDHAVRLVDVERALEGAPTGMRAPASPTPPPPPAPSAPAVAPAGMRQAIAAAVSRSKREIPHYYLSSDIDLGATMKWLSTENARRAVTERLLTAPVLLKATALALRDEPQLNGWWIDGAFRAAGGIHVGVAISLRGGGLIAPAIHDVDGKSIDELMSALRDLVARARGGGLRGSEMTDASITVTNLGDEGADVVIGVIHPPQVAIVGFGRVRERPWAVNGMLGVRPVVTATLSADHRATDGHDGSRFLATLDRLLQHPEAL